MHFYPVSENVHHVIRVLVEGICRGVLHGLNIENERFLEAYVEEVDQGEAPAARSPPILRTARGYPKIPALPASFQNQ